MSTDTLIRIMKQGSGFDVLCSINHSKFKSLQSRSGYITRISFEVNSKPVMQMDLGSNLPNNPVVGIHLTTLELNDLVSATWNDTFGTNETITTSLASQS